MDIVTSVVIVGSGFTGFECARRLAPRLRKTDVEVTIISPVDYMLYPPLLPDVAGGVVDARFVAIPLAGTLKGVRAIRGRVDRVDLKDHRLQITHLEQRTREKSVGRQRGRQPRAREETRVQAPRHGFGGRPGAASGSG